MGHSESIVHIKKEDFFFFFHSNKNPSRLFRHTNDHGPSKRKKNLLRLQRSFFFFYICALYRHERMRLTSAYGGIWLCPSWPDTQLSFRVIQSIKITKFYLKEKPRQRFEILLIWICWTLAPENLDFKKCAICSYVFGEIVRQFKTHLA